MNQAIPNLRINKWKSTIGYINIYSSGFFEMFTVMGVLDDLSIMVSNVSLTKGTKSEIMLTKILYGKIYFQVKYRA